MYTPDSYDEGPSMSGDFPVSPPPSTIVVMGATGSGKTSFTNLASGSKLDVGTNLKSCTEEVQVSEQFTVDDRPVVLVDTPGFHDTFKSDMDILNSIAQWTTTRHEHGEGLTGIIYVHRISDVRFTGSAAKSFRTLLAMCGDRALCNVVIVTNMWGKVTKEVGDARKQELASNFFKHALDNGAQLLDHEDTKESAHDIIRAILDKQQVTLRIQREIVHQGKMIEETAAGKELRRELNERVRRRQEQLQELQEMLDRTEADDGETRQELEQELSRLRQELEMMSRESDQPTLTFRGFMQNAIVVVAVLGVCVVGGYIGGGG